jgi:Activator of Hsp90 ATPase homolog 1-like protein
MTVTAVRKDAQTLTMTLQAEFDASPERVWQMWVDPRQLERWWDPPTYPATFTKYDLAPGGRAEYHMTGPEGDQHRGYWGSTRSSPRTRSPGPELDPKETHCDDDPINNPHPERPRRHARL